MEIGRLCWWLWGEPANLYTVEESFLPANSLAVCLFCPALFLPLFQAVRTPRHAVGAILTPHSLCSLSFSTHPCLYADLPGLSLLLTGRSSYSPPVHSCLHRSSCSSLTTPTPPLPSLLTSLNVLNLSLGVWVFLVQPQLIKFEQQGQIEFYSYNILYLPWCMLFFLSVNTTYHNKTLKPNRMCCLK